MTWANVGKFGVSLFVGVLVGELQRIADTALGQDVMYQIYSVIVFFLVGGIIAVVIWR
jgi:ABC-type transport system involved in cytochrome c biogenesis permease subunit